ncbi:hypothetical protein BWR60_02545 [Inquilinus limosus]|uniref:CobW C-terminal domain-containing protein n=1 Tax=Inquilinus limosus TaxID=171674 RepID=A0A211ZTZ0_9PROT|nr:hypothetical protein BWR60_02545 [Inquilinus limosus]
MAGAEPTGLADGRLRLTVLGGFLGAGKTTWLRHQLHVGLYRDAAVIVNEAAETPVDDALLGQASSLAVLAGGCACCTARAEMVQMLRRICDDRTRSYETGLQRIVLETSGLADPGPIVVAIRSDPVLVHHIVVSEIVVLVDALHGLAQLRTDRLGRRQIETADRLVVTKADAAGEAALARLLATLRHLNPGAELSGAVQGVPLVLPAAEDVEPERLPALEDGAEPPAVFPTRLAIAGAVDWTVFTVWLSALLHARGDDVLRVKGVVRTPAGRLLLQSVRRVVQSPEILPEQPDREDNAVVVIGRGYRVEDLRRSLDRFADGRG